MKKIIFFFAVLSVVFAMPVHADIKMDMMNDKINRLEQDVNALQRKIYQSNETSENVVVDSSGSSDSNSPVAGNLEDLYSRVSAQDLVVRDLTAKIEQLEFRQQELESKLSKMNADVDVRFNMMQNEKTDKKDDPKSTTTPTDKEGKKAYDDAYAIMKKGDYKKAEEAFTLFMKDYPKSTLVGNANYWLGETYYARGLYEQAVGIFADGFTKYKHNSKAADNLLKLGLTMNKLQKKEEACTAFKSLSSEFPKADKKLKDRAEQEAKKLSCK